jgi:hypothetical protein
LLPDCSLTQVYLRLKNYRLLRHPLKKEIGSILLFCSGHHTRRDSKRHYLYNRYNNKNNNFQDATVYWMDTTKSGSTRARRSWTTSRRRSCAFSRRCSCWTSWTTSWSCSGRTRSSPYTNSPVSITVSRLSSSYPFPTLNRVGTAYFSFQGFGNYFYDRPPA